MAHTRAIPSNFIAGVTAALAVLVIFAYAIVSVIAIADVWGAEGLAPTTGEPITYIFTALAGLVGGIVAVAFGVSPPGEKLSGLANLTTSGLTIRDWIGSLYVVVYLAVGAGAVATWIGNESTISDLVKNLAVVTLGMVVPIVAGFFTAPKLYLENYRRSWPVSEADDDADVLRIEPELAWAIDPDSASLDGFEFAEVPESDSEIDKAQPSDREDTVTILGQTNRVRIFNVVCSGNGAGASSSFYVVGGGWGLNLRFGFYRADGARLGLSRIFYWDSAFGVNRGIQWRVNGFLPAGTKQVRAFWWFARPATTQTTYWQAGATNC